MPLPNDPLTSEDAEHVILWSWLTGQQFMLAAHMYFCQLPSSHSAIRSYTSRWEFQTLLLQAQKKLEAEMREAHS